MQRNTRLVLSSAFASVMVVGCDNPELGQSESATPNEQAWFQESTQTAGLTFYHSFGNENQYWFPESIGAGCGLLDVDGDGDLDALFAQGHDLGQPAGSEKPAWVTRNDVQSLRFGCFSNKGWGLKHGKHSNRFCRRIRGQLSCN